MREDTRKGRATTPFSPGRYAQAVGFAKTPKELRDSIGG
jgi:hypothetical protein